MGRMRYPMSGLRVWKVQCRKAQSLSRDSSVAIATDYGLSGRGYILVSCSVDTRFSPPRCKAAGA
jgi:hypothetical protein